VAERIERHGEEVDNLRDQLLGRSPKKAAKAAFVMPQLPPLRDYGPAEPFPFFDPSCAEAAVDSPKADQGDSLDLLRRAGEVAATADHDTSIQTLSQGSADSVILLTDIERKMRPRKMRDAVHKNLQGSESWSRLATTVDVSASKHAAKAAQLHKAASLPSLREQQAPSKPTAPVNYLLPFQANRGAVPRPEAWAPYLSDRAKHAELKMQYRLRLR